MKMDLKHFPDDFIMQWRPVLNQFSEDRTLKENLLAYTYPAPLPNLTRDISNEVVVLGMVVRDKGADPGESRLLWAIQQPDGVYRFNNRIAVCPDGVVLLFD